MKKYNYDNKRRIALSTSTWRRIKSIKKWMKFSNTDKLIRAILDDWEYGIRAESEVE